MTNGEAMLRGMIGSAAMLAALVATPAAAAQADPAAPVVLRQADPFSALVGKRRAPPAPERKIERFLVSADGRAFVLDDRRDDARIKYLCTDEDPRLDCRIDPEAPAEEVFVLTKTRGPRGDVIYRDAYGDVRLRLASYGGATVFWPGEAAGQAASKSYGDDGPLTLPGADFIAASRRAQGAAAQLSARLGAPLYFDIGRGAAGDDASVLADAVARAAAGIERVAADPTGARVFSARVKLVRFLPGAPPRMALDADRFNVVYDPSAGLAGRPSSGSVARFLEENL